VLIAMKLNLKPNLEIEPLVRSVKINIGMKERSYKG